MLTIFMVACKSVCFCVSLDVSTNHVFLSTNRQCKGNTKIYISNVDMEKLHNFF